MKNVIVVALAGARYAIELRWVREVFTTGNVTPVPTAPATISGVVNFHGAIVPMVDLPGLLAACGIEARPAPPPRGGEAAVLIEVEGTRVGIRVDAIDEVSTLLAGPEPNTLLDSRGRTVALLDPPALVEAAQAATTAAAGEPAEGA